MLENLYTTKMSGDAKTLQRRFSKIRSKQSRKSKITAAVMAAALAMTALFATVAMAAIDVNSGDDYTVEITNNGEKIELNNKPFIENGEVYVPLREIFEKAGLNPSNSNIIWDNGKIYITISQNGTAGLFGIELGQKYMNLRHIQPYEIYNASFNTAEPVMSMEMHNVPILRNSNTYIPIKEINYMLYSFLNMRNEDHSLHELSCNVYDKNGNNITTSLDNYSNKLREYEKQKLPYGTAELLFRDFHRQDFENMKTYCTENCVNTFFEKLLDGYSVFGMQNASIRSMSYTNGSSETSDKVLLDISLYSTEFDETSIYAQNRNPFSFRLILQRQPDGRYLIDEFAT